MAMVAASSLEFWEKRYGGQSPLSGGAPHRLAEELHGRLAPGSAVLELGGGQGQDAMYLARKRHRVTVCDFSENALRYFEKAARELGVVQERLDLTVLPYPFEAGSFDAVYARLSLHYFSRDETGEIVSEISRVLHSSGSFYGLFNSCFDIENGQGERLEERYYEVAPGSRKRFFTAEEVDGLFRPAFRSVTAAYVAAANEATERKFVKVVAVR